MQVPDDLVERSEAAKALEVRQRDGHLRFVVVILVNVGSLGV